MVVQENLCIAMSIIGVIVLTGVLIAKSNAGMQATRKMKKILKKFLS